MKQGDFIIDKEIRRMLLLNELKDMFLLITGWGSLLIFGIMLMILVLNVVSKI